MSKGKRQNISKRKTIELTETAKKKLNELSNKYHLSWSTMINIILEKSLTLWTAETLTIAKELCDKYIYPTRQKTNIKVLTKLFDGGLNYDLTSSKHISNLISLFCDKEQKKVDFNKIKNDIYNTFQNTYDPNWKFNQEFRQLCKIARTNKSYFDKTFNK